MKEDISRSDGELLTEFAASGSEQAFGELVRRHGPMVRSACQRVLADHHEAEDVTQAVFLTLARKARQLRGDSSVGGWLHRVAWCLAMDVRKSRDRRHRHEETAMHEACSEIHGVNPADLAGFRAELDAAIAALPERFRQPVVLFHLEERSTEEAAGALGLNSTTLRTRLVRARELLRRRLVRRGVAVGSISALTTLLSAEAGAATLPATFVSATAKAASLAAAGKLAAGVGTGIVSINVAALTKGAANMLFWNSVKTAAIAVAVTGAVVTTGTVAAQKVAEAHAAPNSVSKPASVEPQDLIRHRREENLLAGERVHPTNTADLIGPLDDLPDYTMAPYAQFTKLSKEEQDTLSQADSMFAARKFSEATKQYDSFLHDYPKSIATPYALILKGRSQDKIGAFPPAKKAYSDVLDHFPSEVAYCAPSLFYQARIAVRTKDFVRAKQLLADLEEDAEYRKHDVLPVARQLEAIIHSLANRAPEVTVKSLAEPHRYLVECTVFKTGPDGKTSVASVPKLVVLAGNEGRIDIRSDNDADVISVAVLVTEPDEHQIKLTAKTTVRAKDSKETTEERSAALRKSDQPQSMNAQLMLASWLKALNSRELTAYRECLHSGARNVNEYGTTQAMTFWKREIDDLRKDGFAGMFEFRKPAVVNERFPEGSIQAHPVVNGRTESEYMLLIKENGRWSILRLFS